MKVLSIINITIKEALHDKVLYSLLIFGCFIVLSAHFMGNITPGEKDRMTLDVGLVGMGILCEIMALYYGCFTFFKELERRTLHTLISKPITRTQFLLGKYLGICTVLLMIVILTSVVFLAVIILGHIGKGPNILLSWNLPKAILMVYMEVVLLTALAFFFSVMTASPIVCLLITGTLFILGLYNDLLKNMDTVFQKGIVIKLMHYLAFILPNFQYFDVNSLAASFKPIPMEFINVATLYGLVYSVLLLMMASFVFSRRNLP